MRSPKLGSGAGLTGHGLSHHRGGSLRRNPRPTRTPPTNVAIQVARIIAIGPFTPASPSRGQPLMPAANTMSVIDGADDGNRADLDRAGRAMPSSP